MGRWQSWSGLAVAHPAQVVAPRSPDEVADAVHAARAHGLRVRMVGSGHSFTDVAVTDGLMLDPTNLRGVVSVDRIAMTVTALAGTPLHELNARLDDLGLALHNMGDIDRQTVAGATSTGTHGTGGRRASLSAQLAGLSLVDSSGELVHASATERPELFDAGRVALGALGVLTSLTFGVEPAFTLAATEQPASWDEAVGGYDELVDTNEHVDMYWFPHTDRCLVKTNNRSTAPTQPLSRTRAYVDDELLSNTVFGWVTRATTKWPAITPRVNQVTSRVLSARTYSDASHRVLVSPRRVVFREMEYSLPREHGMAALAEVRRAIDSSDWRISFPVEVRCTPADDAWLSTSYDRQSVYLAFHVPRDVDHRPYFEGIEPILAGYAGRPHWGKLHTRTAADLAEVYPRFKDFTTLRDELDPDRIFTNSYVDRVLGV